MMAYRLSDVKQPPHTGEKGEAPLTCGYIKEGLGMFNTSSPQRKLY